MVELSVVWPGARFMRLLGNKAGCFLQYPGGLGLRIAERIRVLGTLDAINGKQALPKV